MKTFPPVGLMLFSVGAGGALLGDGGAVVVVVVVVVVRQDRLFPTGETHVARKGELAANTRRPPAD